MDQVEQKEIKKPVKKKMTEEEAFGLIQEWGEDMEVRLKEEDFEEVKQEIWMAVAKERLTFDSNEEIFTYVLKKPIKEIDGNKVIYSMLKIKESQMKDKKGMSKSKTDFEASVAMFKSYCTDNEGNEIQIGFLERLYDRDMQTLMAIILGFFVQAVPGRAPQK